MRVNRAKYLLAMIAVALMTSGVWADAKDDAHARRKARWNSVAALLVNGDAQEGENGYLVPEKGIDEEKSAVVAAENKDRKIGYEAIAGEHKTSVEAIARAAGKINRKKADDLKKKK